MSQFLCRGNCCISGTGSILQGVPFGDVHMIDGFIHGVADIIIETKRKAIQIIYDYILEDL